MVRSLSTTPPLSQLIGFRREVAMSALEVFGQWGYREIEVPLLDYFDPLKHALDPTQVNRMFRFVDRDGNLLVLRADVTPAIAKIYANQLTDERLPLRVCYSNKVIRIERAFTREQIESYQLGIELIGAPGTAPEVEIVLVALETLSSLGIDDFEIHLGNSSICERLIALTGAPKSHRELLEAAIRERDPYAVNEQLHALGTREHLVTALVHMTDLSFDEAALGELSRAIGHDDPLQTVLNEFRGLYETLEQLGAVDRVHIDLGIVNDQGYYTGTSFKIVSERLGRILGGGGRYDDLIGRFGSPTPAVGFSLYLDALLELLGGSPKAVTAPPHSADRAALGDDLVKGFGEVLDRRAQGKPTTVVYE
jgi:ATP phosphoribosyltransferase regulatory subunit